MENTPLFFLTFLFISFHEGVRGDGCQNFYLTFPPMDTYACPGSNIIYTCVFSSSSLLVTTKWSGTAFQCPTNNQISLVQRSGGGPPLFPSGSCGSLSAMATNFTNTTSLCYTSVLTILANQTLNGASVICQDASLATPVGSDTLKILTPPVTPNITERNTSLNWFTVVLEPLQSTATSYNVSVNGSVPVPVPAAASYNGRIFDGSIMLESIPSNGALPFTFNFSNVTNTTYYNISVVAINCAGFSMPRTITIGPNYLPETSSSIPSVSTTTNVPTSTNMPTSTSSSGAAVGIGVGVGVGVGIGIVVLVLLVAIAVIIVVIVKNKKESPPSPTENNCGKNEVPLPPRNPDTTLNKPKTDKTSNKPEGMIYADIGLPRKPPMQAPNPEDMNTVVYSSVQKVL